MCAMVHQPRFVGCLAHSSAVDDALYDTVDLQQVES